MDFTLSPRLLMCSEFVRPGEVVADVGCDHGYLGIYLLKKNIAKFVIASDINEGPLSSAKANAEKYRVADRMSFHLCPGVEKIPHNFDVLVCAGMGGDTMISILQAAPWLESGAYRLILQCQTKTHTLRRYLWENGWDISREEPVRDGRFIYTVMEVCRGKVGEVTPGQFYFSPALLKSQKIEAREYLLQMMKKLSFSVNGKGAAATPLEAAALKELEELL